MTHKYMCHHIESLFILGSYWATIDRKLNGKRNIITFFLMMYKLLIPILCVQQLYSI